MRLCARVGPAKNEHWSLLARKLCAAPAAPASVARQPQIMEPCCACDEAKYEVLKRCFDIIRSIFGPVLVPMCTYCGCKHLCIYIKSYVK